MHDIQYKDCYYFLLLKPSRRLQIEDQGCNRITFYKRLRFKDSYVDTLVFFFSKKKTKTQFEINF